MRAILVAAPAIAAAMTLMGCGANHSSIYRSYQISPGANSVLVDAKQRAILSTQSVDNPSGNTKQNLKTITCAEPSPDALSAISTSLAASGSGLFGGGQSVQAALASALRETAGQLGVRNATITLLRDGLYRQCEAYMNGLITPQQYSITTQKYVNAMVTLLAIEQIAPVGATTHTIRAGDGSRVSAITHINMATPGEDDAPVPDDAENSAASGSANGGASGAQEQAGNDDPAEETDADEANTIPRRSLTGDVRAEGSLNGSALSVNVLAAPTQHVPLHVAKAVT